MSMVQIVYLLLIFGVAFAVAWVMLMQLLPGPMQDRLDKIASGGPHEAPHQQEAPGWVRRVVKLSGPLAKLSLPTEGWESSHLRIHFMNAGFRGASAPAIYFAAKSLMAMVLPALASLYLGIFVPGPDVQTTALVLFFAAASGYFLPNAILGRIIFYRKREIFENFPDAIDLMTVCVEAGLGLDAALARVGEEMRMKSRILADELHLVTLELRAGSTRERALRNLALRTAVEEVDSLVAMLVQSDRFGTSVAESLRVHSDSLRTKRRLRAEEAAAKIPVKLLFPMLFFIFPSMLLVLLGPAYISIIRVLLPTLSGH